MLACTFVGTTTGVGGLYSYPLISIELNSTSVELNSTRIELNSAFPSLDEFTGSPTVLISYEMLIPRIANLTVSVIPLSGDVF